MYVCVCDIYAGWKQCSCDPLVWFSFCDKLQWIPCIKTYIVFVHWWMKVKTGQSPHCSFSILSMWHTLSSVLQVGSSLLQALFHLHEPWVEELLQDFTCTHPTPACRFRMDTMSGLCWAVCWWREREEVSLLTKGLSVFPVSSFSRRLWGEGPGWCQWGQNEESEGAVPPRPCLSVKSLVPFISLVLGDGPSYYPVLKVRKLKFKGWLVCCCLIVKSCPTLWPTHGL